MISNVSFGSKGLYDTVNVDAPQAHQKPQQPKADSPHFEEPKKSSHKALKVVAGLVAAAAVAVGAVAIGSQKGWITPDKIKKIIPNKLLNAEKLASWKEPVKKGIAAVESFGNTVAEKATNCFKSVGEFFKKAKPESNTVAENIAEKA